MHTLDNKFNKSIIGIALIKLLEFGLIVSNILVTIVTFAAVIARALNLNLLGYEEILLIFAFWLYMIGSAYGSYEKSHIKADIIVVLMKEGFTKDLISILRDGLSVCLGIIFFLWALQLARWNLQTGAVTPAWRIPVFVSQASLLFGLGIGSLYNLIYLYDSIKTFYLKRIKKADTNVEEDLRKGV